MSAALEAHLLDCQRALAADAKALRWLRTKRIAWGHLWTSPFLGGCGPLGLDAGRRLLLVPAWAEDDLELLGLVSVDPRTGEFWTDWGEAVFWLGAGYVAWCRETKATLPVWPAPMEWLAANGEGAVMIAPAACRFDLDGLAVRAAVPGFAKQLAELVM